MPGDRLVPAGVPGQQPLVDAGLRTRVARTHGGDGRVGEGEAAEDDRTGHDPGRQHLEDPTGDDAGLPREPVAARSLYWLLGGRTGGRSSSPTSWCSTATAIRGSRA